MEGIALYIESLGIAKWAQVFLLSMVPVVELRGSIPWGAYLGLPCIETLIVSVIGNMVPVPFIMLFIRGLFKVFERIPLLRDVTVWIEDHTMKKAGKIAKYSTWGLLLLVAVPLPGTGAWTGAFAATLLDIRLKNAIPVIFIGVFAAGLIVSGIAYGFWSFLGFLL